MDTQPDPSFLCTRIGLERPLIGLYDAPDPGPFAPTVHPEPGECVFASFQRWQEGVTLHLTRDTFGCGGAGRWMCGVQTGPKEDFLSFLVDGEGLKASRELMERWIETSRPYAAEHPHILIGPMKRDLWAYARSITFFVEPDQLALLMLGAQYHSDPDDPLPVIAPFGSGCSLLLRFHDLSIAQALIGATDIAMRRHLPPEVLAFTVTREMFRRLCSLDERSFLDKPFLKRLRKARGLPDF